MPPNKDPDSDLVACQETCAVVAKTMESIAMVYAYFPNLYLVILNY
jgi:hypothetical protein